MECNHRKKIVCKKCGHCQHVAITAGTCETCGALRVHMVGRWWLLRFVPAPWLARGSNGHCDPPDKRKKEIRVYDKLRGNEKLEVILHELNHAANWLHRSEEAVTVEARDTAKILTRMGYCDGKKETKRG